MTISLELPDVRFHLSWQQMIEEFDGGPMDGSGYLAPVDHDLDITTMAEVVVDRRAQELPDAPRPDGHVPCSFRWIADGDELVGFVAIRHGLNDYLLELGGHIGYSVRPSRRGEGIATQALRQAVALAHGRGLAPVLVPCSEDNHASRAVIETNEGAYEDSCDGTRRYWIPGVSPRLDSDGSGPDDVGVTDDAVTGVVEDLVDTAIDEGVVDAAGRRVALVAVTDSNWRDIADVTPRDDQRGYVPTSAARYLLLSQREGVWHSLGVRAGDGIVGHVMWGWDADDQMHRVGGVLIDAAEQGTGVGRAAMVTLVRWLFARPGTDAVRLSYQPNNVAARSLYVGLGFVESDVPVDDEIMAELTAARAAPLL